MSYVDFGFPSPMTGWHANSWVEFFARGKMANTGISFYDIDDPQAVADLVERLREEDQHRTGSPGAAAKVWSADGLEE